jgi:hypothetical protein
MFKEFKYSYITNIFLILFSLFFASIVCNSLIVENELNISMFEQEIYSNDVWFNISIAIVLAACWNGRIIKTIA